MNTHLHVIFAPLIHPALLQMLGVAALLLVLYAIFRRAQGAWLRGLSLALLLLTLANPSLIQEQHEALNDTVLLVVDDSASMEIGNRNVQSASAVQALSDKLKSIPHLDTEILHVQSNQETDLFGAIEQKLGTMPRDRLAGIIAITDGQIHDQPSAIFAAPFHALVAGQKNEFDRRLIIKQSPAYGIVGKTVSLTLRVDDQPESHNETVSLSLVLDKGNSQTITVPIGRDVPLDVPIDHAGQNLLVLTTPAVEGELTPLNNTAAITVNGIRDRLRVLLVSGEPHIGGRTWRNFLKADPAVDLVHFTILRSPMKMDMTPNTEMALIAFPAHELFDVKLSSFDLVILDRFKPQSLVPDTYLDNIARYVENGGALLVSNATEEGIPSLTLSPLARILPTQPTGKLLTGSFTPDLTAAGLRHPVTSRLPQITPQKNWGTWFRQIDSRATSGDVLMSGQNDKPLLVLNHVGKGRVAQFLSDQFWLWAHNYNGGGPQAELLRRVAHWLVFEPELDETALRAKALLSDKGWQMTISKQSVKDASDVVTMTDPQSQTSTVTLQEGRETGVLTATVDGKTLGLYHLQDDEQDINVMVGATDVPEFGEMRGTAEILTPIATASHGSVNWIDGGIPEIRSVGSGSAMSGWNWIGLRHNDQYRVTGSKAYPLWPAGLAIAMLLAAFMLGWWREGSRKS